MTTPSRAEGTPRPPPFFALCPHRHAQPSHQAEELGPRSVIQLSLTLCAPMDCSPPASSVHGDFPGKDTGLGCWFLLQGIFPTQGSNPSLPCLLYWQVDS